MTDEPAFLRAAAAQPDDDTIRLVYADWLDEQGAEPHTSHARFVRLQVRRSRLDSADPDRAALLSEEAQLLRKHRRDWNGRIHRELHRRGLFGLVDSRRGEIRTWDYHRGMIARARVTDDGLAARADLVSSLGPLQWLDLVGWHNWSGAEARELEPLFAGLKVLALRPPLVPPVGVSAFAPIRHVTLLDLRRLPAVPDLAALRRRALAGEVPPVVLYRRTVVTGTPLPSGYVQQDSRQEVHVIDPHNKWEALRPWFADFTGEALAPIRV